MTNASLACPQIPSKRQPIIKDPKVRRFIHNLLEQDRQAAIEQADRKASHAADSLRTLVEGTYGERAEEVKQIIRDRYESADIPDADENG